MNQDSNKDKIQAAVTLLLEMAEGYAHPDPVARVYGACHAVEAELFKVMVEMNERKKPPKSGA